MGLSKTSLVPRTYWKHLILFHQTQTIKVSQLMLSFFYFAKAFDTVPRKRLLLKFNCYGISGLTLNRRKRVILLILRVKLISILKNLEKKITYSQIGLRFQTVKFINLKFIKDLFLQKEYLLSEIKIYFIFKLGFSLLQPISKCLNLKIPTKWSLMNYFQIKLLIIKG